jgi:hypothetical protein
MRGTLEKELDLPLLRIVLHRCRICIKITQVAASQLHVPPSPPHLPEVHPGDSDY